eukprot:COSAG01_NODE_814_length_13398_cov_4.254230_11_plen_264_part_00
MLSQWVNVFFLGLIEGLTEFFPVSSTAHLVLFENILDFQMAHSETFHIAIQLGAILAAVIHFWSFFKPFLSFKYWLSDTAKKLYIAVLPVLFFGFIAYDFIKTNLFSLKTVVIALFIGGVIMLIVEKIIKPKIICTSVESLTYKQALGIGLFQCFSLWPGMSRSGSCIVGSLLLGCSYQVAAQFSFILGVPVLTAAASYDLLKMYHLLSVTDLGMIALGSFISFVIGYLAIISFLTILQRYKLSPFAIYRLFLSGILSYMLWY